MKNMLWPTDVCNSCGQGADQPHLLDCAPNFHHLLPNAQTRELVRLHCKASGPVTFASISSYVLAQHPLAARLLPSDIPDAIWELSDKGVISLYSDENDDEMAWW